MIVILLKDVQGTGKAGDVVKVSDGYARNMLIPKKMAKEATEGNIRSLEKQKALQAEKRAADKAAAEELAAKLATMGVEIKTKGGEGGRLFGSITSKDIADALKDQYKIDIDKKKIELGAPIKQAGDHKVDIKLFSEVTAHLNVKVVAE